MANTSIYNAFERMWQHTVAALDNKMSLPITITLPMGRMKGDVDGDGKITASDVEALSDWIGEDETTDPIVYWCCNIDNNNSINVRDRQYLNSYVLGTSSVLTSTPTMADYYGNWTYVKVDDLSGYFYKDFTISGMTTNSSAIITIQGSYEPNNFSAECMDDVLRIKAKWCPIAEVKAVVQHYAGDGTAVVVCEGTNTTLTGLGVTATAEELNYMDGVTSGVQTQLDSKVSAAQGTENAGKALIVGDDGNVTCGEVASGGGDSGAFTITFNPEGAPRPDKTYTEINEAYNSGKELILLVGNDYRGYLTYRLIYALPSMSSYKFFSMEGDFNAGMYLNLAVYNGDTVTLSSRALVFE